MEKAVISIVFSQIGQMIEDAIRSNKKSILFIDDLLQNEFIDDWFDEHPEYHRFSFKPNNAYEEDKNHILRKIDGTVAMANDRLERLNNETSIWFIWPFGNECIVGFDNVLKSLKTGVFTSEIGNGETIKVSIDKLKLFIGMTTPKGMFSVNVDDYDRFDAVYYVVPC